MFNVSKTTCSELADMLFSPVNVSGGRKFQGFGYVVGYASYMCRFTGESIENAKIWDPKLKRINWCNVKYIKKLDTDSFNIDEAKYDYVMDTIEDTLDYCAGKLKQPLTSKDVESFARSVLLKNHSEMKAAINEAFPLIGDTYSLIEPTVKWASTLKTSKAHVSNGFISTCPIQMDPYEKRNIARKCLEKKDISLRSDFEEKFNECCKNYNLPYNESK